jgi:hypothetical protein
MDNRVVLVLALLTLASPALAQSNPPHDPYPTRRYLPPYSTDAQCWKSDGTPEPCENKREMPGTTAAGVPQTIFPHWRKILVGTGCFQDPVLGCGGNVSEHVAYWQTVASEKADVEVRGPCMSACTLMMSYVPKDNICFSDNALLGFHMPRRGQWKPGEDWSKLPAALDTAAIMVSSYPDDVEAWINAKGGFAQLPMEGFWKLRAPELWAMGYRRCSSGFMWRR